MKKILGKDESKDNSKQGVGIKKVVRHDIAVIGLALRLPGCNTAEEYWNQLKAGADFIGAIPANRKNDIDSFLKVKQHTNEIHYIDAAYLKSIDEFDYSFFGMSPKEASLMDPNQRMFLQVAYEVIDDAGYGGDRIRGTRTGVYVGHSGKSSSYYEWYVSELESGNRAISFTGNLPSVIPSRISYLYDLKGPSMVIDTACSSSLVAVNLACQALRNEECEMAIVGGTSINLFPIEAQEKVGIESTDGRAHTFDASSDGTGSGEGVIAILLKPVADAVRDKDSIYAIIKGTATNQDGASIGLTTPNPAAQEDVIVRAWKDAKISPETVSYIEAHGTGTKLGDPIEVEGLQRAFRKYTKKEQFCGLGAVKTNIGHLDATSGLAGFAKMLMAYKHQQLPAMLHFHMPNKNIEFVNSPVYIVDQLIPWEKETYPRRCGVSSFGLSGTNSHIVLEEYVEEKDEAIAISQLPYFITFSAKNQKSLKALFQKYLVWIYGNQEEQQKLSDLCYTANTGREHHEYRVAMVVDDWNDLSRKLATLLQWNWSDPLEGILYGSHRIVTDQEEQGENQITEEEKRRLSCLAMDGISKIPTATNPLESIWKLLQLYVKGAKVDWSNVYRAGEYHKIHLPAYSFLPSRCWPHVSIQQVKDCDRVAAEPTSTTTLQVKITGNQENHYSTAEQIVAQVFGEVLGYEEINIHADFYDLGGDSLIAVKMIHLLHSKHQIELSLSEFFEHTRIDDFAKYLEANDLEKRQDTVVEQNSDLEQMQETANEVAVSKELRQYYASASQRRIYVLNRMNPDGLSYNVTSVFSIEGELDRNKLEQSFDRLIMRHESLRTSFYMNEKELMQEIHENIEFHLEYVECEKSKFHDIVNEFVRPFHLEEAPLMRAILIKYDTHSYQLVIDLHHMISDGTTIGILIRDLAQIYQGVFLPPLKIQYKDYANWQREYLQTEKAKEQEDYWVDLYQQEVPLLNLFLDYKRPAVQQFDGDQITFKIPHSLSVGLNNLASKHGATLYIILMAAYTIMFHKYTQQEDIVVGSPVAGRGKTEFEETTGLFINMLPFRNYPRKDCTIQEYIDQVKEQVFYGFDHQNVQMENIIRRIHLQRDLSRNPMFDVALILQNTASIDLEIEGVRLKSEKYPNKIAKYDLTLEVAQVNGELNCELEYCTNLFRKDTIQRMAEHFQTILEIMVTEPEQKLKEIDMLSGSEKTQLQTLFNQTDLAYDRTMIYDQWFERAVSEWKNQVAVVVGEVSITYEALNQRANQVASVLRDKGIGPDCLVGIRIHRSIEMIVAMIAVLKAGGAYLPLDPEYPTQRVQYMLDDSKALVLLVDDTYDSNLVYQGEIVNLQQLDYDRLPKENLPINHNAKNLAYVIYTSGSTGKPKGVMLQHQSLVNFINGTTETIEFKHKSTILGVTTVSFDIFVLESLLAFVKGLKVILAKEEEQKEPKRLCQLIQKHQIQMIQLTPSRLSLFMREKMVQEILQNVEVIMVGGEAISVTQLASLKQIYHGKIYNMYGPTETTVWSSIKDLTDTDRITIGKPMANTSFYILDANDQMTAIGVPGELYIGGDGLARGYINREDLTKDRFRVNPYKKDSLMYQTGDVARWLPEGEVEHLGRTDHQVKVRGYRIELSEIENVVKEYPGITENIVSVFEDKVVMLVCYYISKEEINVSKIREFLLAKLSDYMVPTLYIRLDEMPLTSNGKVHRLALPKPENTRPELNVEYVAPRTQVEKEIERIWAKLFELKMVGIHDNFFDLGGNSYQAVLLHDSLNERYPGKLEIADIFSNPTIESLALHLKQSEENVEETVLKPIVMPNDYFVQAGSMNEAKKLIVNLSDTLEQKLNNYVKLKDLLPEDILTSAYAYLFANLSGKQEVEIWSLNGGNEKFVPLDFKMDMIQDWGQLFELAKKERLKSSSYVLRSLKRAEKNTKNQGIVPLISYGESISAQYLEFFPYTLTITSKGTEIRFVIEYNQSIILKNKAEELLKNYIKIINVILK